MDKGREIVNEPFWMHPNSEKEIIGNKCPPDYNPGFCYPEDDCEACWRAWRENNPQTNFDRLRSMGEEDLAHFLWMRQFDDSIFPMDITEMNTVTNWLRWLRQEVKE